MPHNPIKENIELRITLAPGMRFGEGPIVIDQNGRKITIWLKGGDSRRIVDQEVERLRDKLIDPQPPTTRDHEF